MSATEMKKEIPYKIYISEADMPKAWYNLRADMINKPAPLLNPKTLQLQNALRPHHYLPYTLLAQVPQTQ